MQNSSQRIFLSSLTGEILDRADPYRAPYHQILTESSFLGEIFLQNPRTMSVFFVTYIVVGW